MRLRFLFTFCIAASIIVSCTREDNEDNTSNDSNNDTPVVILNPHQVDLQNGNFENDLDGWTIKRYSNGDKTTVEIVEGLGVKNTKCLKIQQYPNDGKCCVGVEREVTGLEPDQMYRMKARIRYSDIVDGEGTGPVIFSPNTKQYWNASEYVYGTALDIWRTVSVDFLADDDGKANITAALGFWQGGLANGGRSTGTAYFDNISVKKVTNELYMMESDHMRIFLDPTLVSISSEIIKEWIDNIDPMYEAMAELMGAMPHEGHKLLILTSPGLYAGYWAVAGYPIIWNSYNPNSILNTLYQIRDYEDMSFGLMHEMGHVFNIGNTSWNWNDEMFANFRMHYALVKTGLKVYQTDAYGESKVFTGSEILNLYKPDYENTIANK